MSGRINKSKEELKIEIARKEKMDRNIALAKLIFPFLTDAKTIYDAQTALQASAGFLSFELKKKEIAYKVKDLPVDLSKEKDELMKGIINHILEQSAPESATETIELLQSFAKSLGQFAAAQYLKNPMSNLKMSDIISK